MESNKLTVYWGVWNTRKNAWKCFFKCKKCAEDEVQMWGPDYLRVYMTTIDEPVAPENVNV